MWQRIKNFYHLLVALLFCLYYRFPGRKLKVIGVTGTDGKTTTVNLIFHILKTAGRRVSVISTVNAVIGGKSLATGLHVTTPDPRIVQRLLRQAVEKGSQDLVLEVTSHALDQNRVFGIPFEVGVLTNITREHLDYHKTYENYLMTKVKLLRKANWAVVNRDDESYRKISNIKYQISNIIAYGIKHKADVVATDVFLSPTLSKFTVRCMDTSNRGAKKDVKVKTKLLGEYNVYNCLAAIGCTKILGINDKVIKKALASFKPVEGRMEYIDCGQPFSVIIDFAHTPNALEKVLTTIKSLYPSINNQQSTIILVFGCAGLRDRQKRPMMGEIAAKLADLIVLTAEDPRTEDVEEIIEQIATGCLVAGAKEASVRHYNNMYYCSGRRAVFFRIPDRQKAINFAVQKLAKKGDIVLITGKGHERSMCFGKTEYPWSDKKAVFQALKKKVSL